MSFEIHSYHININYGDSAVHLLVDTNRYPKPRKPHPLRGYVHNAILIDGGTENTGCWFLKKALDEIDSLYEFPPHVHAGEHNDGKRYLMFDSVVVSHWDNDHYGGLLQLIRMDLEELVQKTLTPSGNPKPMEEAKYLEAVEEAARKARCRYFKYNDDDERSPATTFYTPYWKNGWQMPETDGLRNEDLDEDEANAAREKVPPAELEAVFSDPEHPNDPSHHDPTKPVRLKWYLPSFGTSVVACDLVAGHKLLLGTDLFSGTVLPEDVPFANVDSVEKLVKHHDAALPGVYCIAADSYRLGSDKRIPLGFSSHFDLRSSQKPSPSIDTNPVIVGSPMVVDKKNTSSNMSSIVCVVAWPLDSNDQSLLTHYFGGDAGAEIENDLLAWLPTKCSVMKLGHHGAASSTPTGLLRKLNPDAIIVSAGDNVGWKHPAWETLIYLDAYHRFRVGVSDKFQLMPLLSTSFPIYFCKTKAADGNSWNYCMGVGETSAFDDMPDIDPPKKDNPVAMFQADITDLYKKLGRNLLREYQAIPAAEKRKRRKWLLNELERAWITSLSSIESSTLVISGTYNSSKKPQMVTRDFLVTYIVAFQSAEGVKVNYKINGESQERSHQGSYSRHPDDTGSSSSSSTFSVTAVSALSFASSYSSSSSSSSSYVPIGPQTNLVDPATLPDGMVDSDDDGVTALELKKQVKGTSPLTASPANLTIYSSAYAGVVPKTLPLGLLNDFVTALNCAAIVLNGPSLTPLAGTGLELVPNDDWMIWMATTAANATGIFVLGQDTTPSSLRLEITVPVPKSPADLSPPLPWKATYKTSNWKSAFGNNVVLNDFGLLNIQNSMIFSLDSALINTTLGQVFDVFNLANTLTGLLDGITLQVDTSQGSRNAVWFLPTFNYNTTLRLQFQVNATDEIHLQSFLQSILGSSVSIDSPVVIARKSTLRSDIKYDKTEGQTFVGRVTPEIIVGMNVTDTKANFQMSAYLQFDVNRDSLILFFDTPMSLDHVLSWLFEIFDIQVFSLPSVLPMKADVTLRRVLITLDKSFSLSDFSLDCELDCSFGASDPNSTVKFDLTYRYPGEVFSGILWTRTPTNLVFPVDYSLTAEYEKYRIIFPTYPRTQADQSGLSLVDLHPGNTIPTPPSGLHPFIVAATIEVDPIGISLGGYVNIIQNPAGGSSTLSAVPTIALVGATVQASYTFATPDTPSSFAASLSMSITLRPKDPSRPTATVIGSIGYDSRPALWTFDGRLLGMSLATLYSLFDNKCSDSLMKVLGKIGIKYLDIMHNFDQLGAASDLTVVGVIILDVLELDLNYSHTGKDWKFTARIRETGTGPKVTTLNAIVSQICGSSVADELPSFVSQIQVSTGGTSSLPLISMVTALTPGDTPHVLFEMTIHLGNNFSISFVQIHNPSADDTQEPKRVIKLTVQTLPGVSSIPLVGNLDQPLPAMDFVWVHDTGGQGLTREEVRLINSEAEVTLLFKDTVPPTTQKNTDLILCPGLHFVVYENSDIILDYHSPPPTAQFFAVAKATESPAQEDSSSDPNPAAMAPWKKTFGPLTIGNVGLHLKGSVLWVYFDASCHLGPIEIALLGLGLGFDFAGLTLNDLSKLAGHVKLNINGLALAFNEPPVSLAGIFERMGPESYVGGVVLGLDPYSFMAVGSYGNITYGSDSFKSVFVFARLDGPLLNLEVAEVTGLKAGFGYNSSLRYPDVSQIANFPFITNALTDETTDPMTLLAQICGTPDSNSGWITPMDGPFWLAAGLDLTAFEVINASAVVTISFSPAVSIGMFADVVASMPADAAPRDSFLYAELGLVSTIDFIHGTMITEGQLAPNSFVLNPSCHLSGGFAMCYWFFGSHHIGDWVYTAGGYANGYTPQPWYPKTERLGISWSLDSTLSLTGEAYFAITPKICMGGGSLAAVFNCGPLGAHFDAYADFMINYRPFFFQGDIGVNVGVDFTLDLFFFTIHISVDISASLHLQGPPFGGVVHVDFYLFGFDIHFGDDSGDTPKLKLGQFIDLLHQSSTPGDSGSGWGPFTPQAERSLSKPRVTATDRKDFILTLEKGAGQLLNKSTRIVEDTPWLVLAGTMQFRVSGVFAMTSASCNETLPASSKVAWTTPFYSKPMGVTKGTTITAPMRVTIDDDEGFLKASTKPFRITSVTKQVPTALWGPYNSHDDPSIPGQQASNTLLTPDQPTIELMLGLDVASPEPDLSDDNIPKFNAVTEMSRDVFSEDPARPGLPTPQPSEIPFMPPDTGPQTLWIPEVSPYAGTPQAWEDVKTVWQAPEADPQYTVDAWAKVFGWDREKDFDLVGKVPKFLIAEFSNLYMACPLIPDSDLIGA